MRVYFVLRKVAALDLLLWVVFILGFIAQQQNATTMTSHFILITVSNTADDGIVLKRYTDTSSILNCARRCSRLSAMSFYFDGPTSNCYCNSQQDTNVIAESQTTSIMYGYSTTSDVTNVTVADQQKANRTGTDFECQEIYNDGFRTDGVYTVNSSSGTLEDVYCNLTTLGWFIFQRRFDGTVDFYRNWSDYSNGFGNPDGEFWLGLDTIHQMTIGGCELHIYLEAEPGVTEQDKGYAKYSYFEVANSASKYTLRVNGFSGNVGNAMKKQNGHNFSTYDFDNDNKDTDHCAQIYKGAWWYYPCHDSNLNGLYLGGAHTSFADGMEWRYPWGYHYSLIRTEMAIRC